MKRIINEFNPYPGYATYLQLQLLTNQSYCTEYSLSFVTVHQIDQKMAASSPFHSAVDAIFQNWTALQLAVSQGAAGPQSADKAKWMVPATVQWFSENKDLECYEVEDFLIDVLNQEFNVLVDDGSVTEISRLVCEFYRLSTTKDCQEELQRRLQALPKCDLSKCQVEQGEPGEEQHVDEECSNTDDEHGMDVDEQKAETEEDPDGWTVVKPRKKK